MGDGASKSFLRSNAHSGIKEGRLGRRTDDRHHCKIYMDTGGRILYRYDYELHCHADVQHYIKT